MILSLSQNGETGWGMLYDPIGDDWAIATRGQGARFVKSDGAETQRLFSQDCDRIASNAIGRYE